MNCKLACEILEMDEDVKELKYIRKQYHKLALLCHPDKNGNTDESKLKFQRINEAYEFLLLSQEDKEIEKSNENTSGYFDILNVFLSGILNNEVFAEIVKDVALKRLSSKLFETLDEESCLKVYSFLSKNKNILHLSEDILEKVKEIIDKKKTSCSNENNNDNKVNILLTPSVDDLFNNNVYKLIVDEQLYLVPLWHSELYFDGSSGSEIIVTCEPNLGPSNSIDENNNLYVSLELAYDKIREMLLEGNEDNKCVNFFIGTKEFFIPLRELFMRREQIYRIKNQGISKIRENNIYDVRDKADVIVKLIIK